VRSYAERATAGEDEEVADSDPDASAPEDDDEDESNDLAVGIGKNMIPRNVYFTGGLIFWNKI